MVKIKRVIFAGLSLMASFSVAVVPVYNTYATSDKITVTYPYYGFVEDPENPWSSVYDALDETDTIEYSDEFFFRAVSWGSSRASSYVLCFSVSRL